MHIHKERERHLPMTWSCRYIFYVIYLFHFSNNNTGRCPYPRLRECICDVEVVIEILLESLRSPLKHNNILVGNYLQQQVFTEHKKPFLTVHII